MLSVIATNSASYIAISKYYHTNLAIESIDDYQRTRRYSKTS